MEKGKNKELEYFRTVSYTSPDSYTKYRRLSEFNVKVSIAEEDFKEEISLNLLNQTAGSQTIYVDNILKKINDTGVNDYADYQSMLKFIRDHELAWKDMDAFYRTLTDFFILELQPDGRISYFNKEPDIPTDYDAPEMAFLNKGIGFLTAEDVEKTTAFNEKYGKYNRDSWDIQTRDIMPEKRFLEMLTKIWGILGEVPMKFTKSAAGEVEDKLYQLKFYIFNALQDESLRNIKLHVNNINNMLLKDQGKPCFENFEIFINSLEYNYPVKHSVAYYVYQWRENLKHFKKEILDNLIGLEKTSRAAYLERLEFGCKEFLKNINVYRSSIDQWLEKYETTEIEIFDPSPFISSELNKVLISDVPKFHDAFEEGFNGDTEAIQHDFYNYHYGETLFEALTFINDKAGRGDSAEKTSLRKKIRSELTVGQLAYFFKLMMDEKLISFKAKTEVYNFIADNFDTSRQGDISSDSVKNKMDSPNPKDMDLVKEKLLHMLQFLKKDSEK